MYVRPFDYLRVDSLEAASQALIEQGPGSWVIAGGQSLMPLLNVGLAEVDILVDISRVRGYADVTYTNELIEIGALATHRTLEKDAAITTGAPLLAAAIGHIGNVRVRNVGTIGGSVAHNDPAGEVPLVLAVLGATYRLDRGVDTRSVAAAHFTKGSFETVLSRGELVATVSLPPTQLGSGWGFHEFAYRPGDFAVAAAAATARIQDEVVADLHLGVTGLGGGPLRCRSFEEAALGAAPADLAGLEHLISSDFGYVADSVESSAYRSHLATVMAGRAVADAVRRSMAAA
jgi:carbon-monoxide dehydrogenase medium subunit